MPSQKNHNSLPLIGGHVSAAGGFFHAIENAQRIGANAIQFFGASPRQWYAKLPTPETVKQYKDALKNSNVQAVYLHAAYLPNLATASEESYEKSIKSLSEHLQIVQMIGAQGLIFHMGAYPKDSSRNAAIEQTAKGMKEVLKRTPGSAFLVMENSAGGGGKLGNTAVELGAIKHLVKSDRVKVCFDTAHGFEAGELGPDVTPENVKKTFDEWDKEINLKDLIALHVNDSKTKYNSNHDRHENLGHGEIGLNGFKALAADKHLHHAAWILEVPGFDNEGPDKENVEILKSCFK
ncbi:MAG: deoxyribonuclease IV [Candidatus Gracilibacteria bacterium]